MSSYATHHLTHFSFYSSDEDGHFWKIFRHCILVFLVLGTIVPFLPLPEVTRESLEKLPPQMAKLIIAKKPPPKPVVQKPKAIKPKEVKPKKKIEEKPKPKVKQKEKPKPIVKKVEKKKASPQEKKLAREQANRSGLMTMKNELAALRDMASVPLPTKSTIKKAGNTNLNNSLAQSRDILASQAKKTHSANVSRSVSRSNDSANSAFVEVAATQLTSDQLEDKGQLTNKGETTIAKANNNGQLTNRDEESIRRIFDKNKSAIFTLYSRALRKNSSLQGKVTIELEINPAGKVIYCKIVSSELGDKKLERKIVTRVKMLDFGAQNVASSKIQYSFDFLPS